MAIGNTTTYDAILKTIYNKKGLEKAVFDGRMRPATRLLEKDSTFKGKGQVFVIQTHDGQKGSATFTDAQNAGAAGFYEMTLQPADDYAVAKITEELRLRTKGDGAAFVEGLKSETDSAYRTIANRLEQGLFQDGYGSLGTVSGTESDDTLYLNPAVNMASIFPTQQIVAAANTSSTPRNSGTAGVVESVDAKNHKIIFTAAVAGTNQAVLNDTLFPKGDYNTASTAERVRGFPAWIPKNVPTTGDSFFGLDRSVDPIHLSGHRFTGSYTTLEDELTDAVAEMGSYLAFPDVVFMSPKTFGRLVKEKGVDRRYENGSKEAALGFQGFELLYGGGTIKVIVAPACPDNIMWVLQMETWKLLSMGELIHPIRYNGVVEVHQTNTTDREIRYQSWHQLVCRYPGANARIDLS